MNTMIVEVALADVASFLNGGTPSRSNPEYFEGTIPWITGADILADSSIVSNARSHITREAIARSAANLVPAGTVLLVTRTGVGKAAIAGVDLAYSQDITAIVHDEDKITPAYLLRCLKYMAPRFKALAQGATIQGITREVVEETLIPLPPIEEQRRIAAVLDAADALRAKRREAIAKLDSLTQAIFIDMFGDLARNNRQWPVVPIGDFVEGFQTGRSVSAAPNETDGDYRVLKVSAVTSLTYKPDQAKPVPPGYQPRASHIVRAGDLLMSRANTSELVGRCAYVQETPPAMLLPDKLWRFMWSQPQRAEPRFVWKALQNRRFRGDIADIATGSSGSMKNISQKGFLRLTIPLPPIGLQTAFTARFRAITDLGSQKAAELQALDTLFASLQQRAFRGEL